MFIYYNQKSNSPTLLFYFFFFFQSTDWNVVFSLYFVWSVLFSAMLIMNFNVGTIILCTILCKCDVYYYNRILLYRLSTSYSQMIGGNGGHLFVINTIKNWVWFTTLYWINKLLIILIYNLKFFCFLFLKFSHDLAYSVIFWRYNCCYYLWIVFKT